MWGGECGSSPCLYLCEQLAAVVSSVHVSALHRFVRLLHNGVRTHRAAQPTHRPTVWNPAGQFVLMPLRPLMNASPFRVVHGEGGDGGAQRAAQTSRTALPQRRRHRKQHLSASVSDSRTPVDSENPKQAADDSEHTLASIRRIPLRKHRKQRLQWLHDRRSLGRCAHSALPQRALPSRRCFTAVCAQCAADELRGSPALLSLLPSCRSVNGMLLREISIARFRSKSWHAHIGRTNCRRGLRSRKTAHCLGAAIERTKGML